jgi:hypothetical protein
MLSKLIANDALVGVFGARKTRPDRRRADAPPAVLASRIAHGLAGALFQIGRSPPLVARRMRTHQRASYGLGGTPAQECRFSSSI